MDARNFDTLARGLAERGWSRRRLSHPLAAGAIAVLLGWGTWDAGAKRKKRNKKKRPACARNCAGKGCGDADGCGGLCTACPSGKTCQVNQCVDACAPDCAGKGCGDGDGCGGACTACPSGQTCQGGQCVADACDPPCRGAHSCQNGSCVCPPGMKSCDINFCGECCVHADCPEPFIPGPAFYQCWSGGDDNIARCRCFALPGHECKQ